LPSAGSGTISFSEGSCTNCGVAMDSVNNKAVIALSLADQMGVYVGGYRILDLGTSLFEPAFLSQAPSSPFRANISENIMVDPLLNYILSPNELSNYELVLVDLAMTPTPPPTFFEQTIPGSLSLDSAGEDCSTGIALASVENESNLDPSQVYIADLSQAVFTPGTWTDSGAQVQTLTDSFLANGATGLAVAQGTHTGVITGENSFFSPSDSAITAIALPTTSGSGITAITDWVTCNLFALGDVVFRHGRDPHRVTAYKSPNNGHAIALLADRDATRLAVVDLTNMLDRGLVPRTSGDHACAPTTTLPVTFITVP